MTRHGRTKWTAAEETLTSDRGSGHEIEANNNLTQTSSSSESFDNFGTPR